MKKQMQFVVVVKQHLKHNNMFLRNGTKTPLLANHGAKGVISNELVQINSSYYASFIRMLWWVVEIGRLVIICEVLMMSSYIAMPREGHLQQIFHIFTYLTMYHNYRIVLESLYPKIDEKEFEKRDCKNFYGNLMEEIPSNAPLALNQEFIARAYVGADFAGEHLKQRSRTGFVIMLNSATIF